ncbi:MAG: putative addiction module killer protein [Candidatus Accumulibacter phosphatis]|jgi:putative addiction module killer protein|uniref:Putative addiction module killer protein n=1 Tax=Candidatus Accumulibacter phosphatis TaxID=327160 RepID=A0A080MA44_9PROT|nr:type II toxin-antitoxin system RelE/ParE family toxin [Accumulibacter sp.]KFB73999.1 MAG: putative addiction module killer protein [Candidatus Accumulibacter phosphatis]HRF12041.1 type II toxin-antitoxin system RelE/ParE family toxin [Candidatus Accumulibacter phosphatis]
MFNVIKSESFDRWLLSLKDRVAVARIQARIRRLCDGNFGDSKPVREGIGEMRIDHGPGYRVYFMRRGPLVIVLLVGGDKSTQEADVERAIKMVRDWKD